MVKRHIQRPAEPGAESRSASEHDQCVDKSQALLSQLLPPAWTVLRGGTRDPVNDVRPPDLYIVPEPPLGTLKPYYRFLDAQVIVEVADGDSLKHDTFRAEWGPWTSTRFLWLVNLRDCLVEVYSEPTKESGRSHYGRIDVLQRDQSFPLILNGQKVAMIKVSDLLP
jgi:hypothetical protein